MTRRARLALLVVTIAAAVISAGCGDDAPSGTATTLPAPTATTNPDLPGARGNDAPSRIVVATVETDPVPNSGDAADDPAIWIDPGDRARSTVIATDHDGGLAVYDLAGKQLQYLPDGNMNNVDVRDGFQLAGRSVSLVTASNRQANTIAIYMVNPQTRLLENVAARPIQPLVLSDGSCMYHSARTGAFHYFVTSEEGAVEQWELFDAGGRVDARKVRDLQVASGQRLGACVADDELGALYVSEKKVGIWRYGAEPTDGDARVKVDSAGSGGRLVADVEGLTIAYGAAGDGQLVASSQGNNSFAVYARAGNNVFLARFEIRGGSLVDGTEDTDGIAVSTANLGPLFPGGVFVAQDGENDGGNQNFKLVPWVSIVGTGFTQL
jgi:3-phytase